jgi:hypothetical protein
MDFIRSETAFFRDEQTKEAIVALASSEALVIYCGAGVTIDRTGLNWRELLARLFYREADDAPNYPTAEETAILKEKLPPLEFASVLAQYNLVRHGDDEAVRRALIPRLQQALYKSAGWQTGAVVANIVRLAFQFANLGRPVIIATSNYDTYVEDAFVQYAFDLAGHGASEIAGLDIRALPNSRLQQRKPTGQARTVKIVYLHGRVPPTGNLDGQLALSENDYIRNHKAVVTNLTAAFTNSAILVLGSSLRDPPLLEALSATRGQALSRVALMPAVSTGLADVSKADFGRLREHLRARARQFEVELLVPDFKFQIAQLCQEVFTAARMPDGPPVYIGPTGARYGMRLGEWWRLWKEFPGSAPDLLFERLRDAQEQIVRLIHHRWNGKRASEERFKTELWIRDPDEQQRCMSLWASSAGVLYDRSILRTEELAINSTHASVQAFIEGRPQYLDRTELSRIAGQQPSASRWQAFLSVPVRADLPYGDVPVGVVTLATMKEKDSSGIPAGSVREMETIVGLLATLGHELVTVPAQHPQPASS